MNFLNAYRPIIVLPVLRNMLNAKNEMCPCGIKRQKLNEVNWQRHIKSCKIRKSSIGYNLINTYYSKISGE